MVVRRKSERRGFSFLELVICVLVMGILAGVAAPRYAEAQGAIELKCAANRLAADLRHAQRLSVSLSIDHGLAFTTEPSAYQSQSGSGATIEDPAHPGAALSVTFDADNSRVWIQDADFGGLDRVSFDFRGEPTGAGTVTLTNGTATAVVAVSETGVVSVTL